MEALLARSYSTGVGTMHVRRHTVSVLDLNKYMPRTLSESHSRLRVASEGQFLIRISPPVIFRV